ncbi:asparagine synthase (glutamine-hydrolyzing) [uncultured Psychroserpens sp.]|uniref:asparagine synthase (glutamine-hydrolyzing) n=1 Tax=uncultured Psychroserpens sp. TaxID=255436 RepID=UPI002634A149|nr:asparagine synthase (glutamine-hydrolyzing) [uncultured Psychroserpens sp.]
MCGFLVEFTFADHSLTLLEDFKNLLDLSKHRGPDSSLVTREKQYQLGFNRLSILDLSSNGNQPKQSPSSRYHITFNGEIYNFKALSATYQLNNLESTSDTEVILHLLDKIGFKNTINELSGMFALAVVDTQLDLLYLARDYIGVKPLFYGVSQEGVVASSQFNQIFKHKWFNATLTLRPEIMKEYFGFGFMQPPNTVFEKIFQVNPGDCITIDRKGIVSIENYKPFDFSVKTKIQDEDLFNTEIQDCIKFAIKQQLVSDVPLGTFLSGGIDSPLVTAMAFQEHSNIEAFTMSVNDSAIDESKAAKTYAEALGVKHTVERIETKELLTVIDAHFKLLPEPFGSYSSIPTYLISKKAAQNHKVMLSGDGGDELFFGYPRMLDVLGKRFWFVMPHVIRRYLVKIGYKLNIVNTWAPHDHATFASFIMGKHLNIYKKKLDEMFPETNFSKEMQTVYNFPSRYTKSELLNWMRENEMKSHLQRTLIKIDRMSMANGLEVRVPLLDQKVVEHCLKYSPSQFNNRNDLKKCLKQIILNFYSKSHIQTEKKGFEVPMQKWLKNDLKDEVKNTIFNHKFYGAEQLDVSVLKSHVNDFYEEKHTKFWGIWHIYAWQKWAIANDLI